MLDKTYDAHALEARLYPQWEESGVFGCRPDSGRAPYTIVIPPPNVTGSLHMGHALNNTLQDILIRYQRMRGRDTLWQPGMDHAGIATQMVVERQLEEAGSSRLELGREKFVERVWDWKAHSGGTITGQLRRLGSSCDWGRERFTMDEGLSRAVLKVFVDLYKQGLIYKDNRLVNWDPKLHTAISDLEVQQREVRGKLWYFRYPLEDDPSRWVVVATTRPETMLGDTGVAVHPDDERYRDLVGKHVILPLVGRRIPIVADDYADPEQGSGAVKITPAHDFNDFEVGRRCGLETISVMDELARINDNAPELYRGLDRFEARTRVVADIEAAGLLDKVEDHTHMVPYGDRGGVPIEPFLTEQWYVDAATLAKPAIQAVEQGRTKFVPENWAKTYYDWMHNIQPWCISRQLWWGHQIPAWYGPDGEMFVELSESEAQAAADAHYGKPVALTRDPDVLDTWFSSALWPFSTLGWPDETPELARYYPTDVLVTAFDIIFFWVARMMMMGLHFMDEVPFHTVYIHALVRDEKGEKMSKSKGNIIDPLVLIDKFGADALRFTLAAMAAMGRDIKLAESRVEGYRNFGTKLWNAARLCEMNGCKPDPGYDPGTCQLTLNKWITGEAAELSNRVTTALDAYRFNEAASAIYQFVWHSFCDWYLESAKPVFLGQDEAAKAETQATAAWVLDQIYRLLHPFMPYITEELAAHLHGETNRGWLVDQPWPEPEAAAGDPAAAAEMSWVIELITEARSLRSQMNVPAGAKIPLALTGADATARGRLETHRDLIERMARLSGAEVDDDVARNGAVQFPVEGGTALLLLDGVIDISQESARLERETAKLDGDIAKLDKKLANEQFLAKAPEAVVEEQRERRADFVAARDKLRRALDSLRAA